MINLIVAYYENIGPFKDTCCSLIFDEGKYLIKAPIGSGKSFLFFDGPRYALYKNSDRNMLNMKSDSGEISMIFEVNGAYYLVKRILTRAKGGNDSCSSQFFNINYDGENLLKEIKSLIGSTEILQRGENVIEKFESQNKKFWKIEKVPLKGEKEVQDYLNDILPSKDVFLNTVFLLQNADNIFDTGETFRIGILKKTFDLLGFDEAVCTVKDKKKSTESQLNSLKDTSKFDTKLRENVKGLYSKINLLMEDDELRSILAENDEFFYPVEQSLDNLTINDFTLNGFDRKCFEKAEQLIQKRMEVVIKLDAQLNEFQKQVSTITQQKTKTVNDIQTAKLDISDLQKKIENIDMKKGEELKKKKDDVFQKKETLQKSADYSEFTGLIEFWNNNTGIEDGFETLETPNDLKSAFDILKMMREAGRTINLSIDKKNSDLKYIDLQTKNWQDNHVREIEKLKDLKSSNEDRIKEKEIALEDHEKTWAEKSDFDCPDLCKKCPHINAINKQQYDQYSQKKEKLKQELETMRAEYEKQDFDNKIKELESQKAPQGDLNKKELEKRIKEQTDFSNSLRDYLMKIRFAEWEKSYHEYESLTKEFENLEIEFSKWDKESNNLEKYKQDKVVLETSIQHFEKSLQDYDKQIDDLNVKIQCVRQEITTSSSEQLQQQNNGLKQISLHISTIDGLIQDHMDNKNLIKKLEEDVRKLKDLIDILSSRVILYALCQYLPALSEIINNYLSQCVDYSIKMEAVEKVVKGVTDIELNVKIIDSKGERDVKSLSGGQRTILNLVWMLAISSYLNTPLLFLDETINNLDADTVGKVSEMINNFVKQRTMKFYTVTHNKEIQDMQIWDDVIEIIN